MLTLAFTVKLPKIHTCSHTCSHQPQLVFLHLPSFSLQMDNIQLLPTINLSINAKYATHFRTMLSMKVFTDLTWTTCIQELLYIFFSICFLPSDFTSLVPTQHSKISSLQKIKSLCTNLEICHAILPQIA